LNIARRLVSDAGTEPLVCSELTLEELAAAANGASGVAIDEIDRCARGEGVTLTGSDLRLERFANGATRHLRRRLRDICKLGASHSNVEPK
jgi:hypothetical protein